MPTLKSTWCARMFVAVWAALPGMTSFCYTRNSAKGEAAINNMPSPAINANMPSEILVAGLVIWMSNCY